VARLRQGRQSRWKDGFSVRLQKNTGKMGKSSVPVLSAQKPWFSQGFLHFGEVSSFGRLLRPCNSVHGGMRRCISRRAAQIESFFESRESSKHWGFAWPRLAPLHARGRGRIRTIISISMHFTTHRELPSHARSPFRSCLHPVLVPLKWSFGILIS